MFWDAHKSMLMVGFSTWTHTCSVIRTKASVRALALLLVHNFQQKLAERGKETFTLRFQLCRVLTDDMHKGFYQMFTMRNHLILHS